jgi:hypothetical protein
MRFNRGCHFVAIDSNLRNYAPQRHVRTDDGEINIPRSVTVALEMFTATISYQ